MPPTTHVSQPAPPPTPFTWPSSDQLLRLLADGWRTDLERFLQNGLPRILAALLLAIIAQRITIFLVRRLRRRADAMVANSQRAAQLRTIAAIVRATAYGIVGFYLLTQILAGLGVSLGPFIASAGVIGLGISFGAQSIFKDMLNGIFILLEDQFSVGDTIKVASLTGTVEDVSLRVTRLRDGGDGTVYIIPNSQITTVANLSRDYSVGALNIQVSSSVDPTRVLTLLARLTTALRSDPNFKDLILADPSILGVDHLSAHAITYPIVLRVRVNQRDGVLRELRQRILVAFQREDIPFGADTATLVMQPELPSTTPAS